MFRIHDIIVPDFRYPFLRNRGYIFVVIFNVFRWGATVSPQVTTQVKLESGKLSALLEYCSTAKIRKEMQKFCEIKTTEYFKKSIVKPMLAEGLILQRSSPPLQDMYSPHRFRQSSDLGTDYRTIPSMFPLLLFSCSLFFTPVSYRECPYTSDSFSFLFSCSFYGFTNHKHRIIRFRFPNINIICIPIKSSSGSCGVQM